MSPTLLEVVQHYKKKIERNNVEEKILHCFDKLMRLPVTLEILSETGVGKTVNAFRRDQGAVGSRSRQLVSKWKRIFEESEAAGDTDTRTSPDGYNHSDDDGHSDDRPSSTPLDRRDSGSPSASERTASRDTAENGTHHRNGHAPHEQPIVNGHDRRSLKHSSRRREEAGRTREESPSVEQPPSAGQNGRADKHAVDTLKSSNGHKHKSSQEKQGQDSDSQHSSKHRKHRSESRPADNGVLRHSNHNAERKDDVFKHSSKKQEDAKHSSKKHDVFKHSSKKHDDVTKHSSKKNDDAVKHSSHKHDDAAKHSSKHRDGSTKHSSKHRNDAAKNGTHFGDDDMDSGSKHHDVDSKHVSQHDDDVVKHSDEDANKHSSTKHRDEATKRSSKHHKHKSSSRSDRSGDRRSSSSRSVARDTSSPSPAAGPSHHPSVPNSPSPDPGTRPQVEELANGVSFADMLGGLDVPVAKKKKKKHKSSKSLPTSQNSADSRVPDLSPPPARAPPFHPPPHPAPAPEFDLPPPPARAPVLDLSDALPDISATYRPLPRPPVSLSGSTAPTVAAVSPVKRAINDEEALAAVLAGKNKRTKVYSGVKSSGWTRLPTLIDICLRCLQENIDYLEYTGGVPYDILRPVLEKCTAEQLHTIEYYNSYLMEDTAPLWEGFVRKQFRTATREEYESWKEMYMRCSEEREEKLNKLRTAIEGKRQDSLANSRKTKLAFENTVAKPPRNIMRKQAKNGTAVALSSPTPGMPGQPRSTRPTPGADPTAQQRATAPRNNGAAQPLKRKAAPLMAKVLRAMGGRR